MLSLARQTIRGRRSGFVAAFVAVFCGAALITACGVLVDSGLRAGIPPERYAAASVVVGAGQSLAVSGESSQPFADRVPLPADDVERIARVPGVRTAVGDVSVAVDVPGVGAAAVHGWSSTVLGSVALVAGHQPQAPTDVVFSSAAGVRLGADVDLVTGGVPARYHVVGLTTAVFPRQQAVYVTDQQARAMSGRPGRVDTVGVLAAPGVAADQLAQRIGQAVPGVVTYTGNARADAEFLDVGQARSFLTAISSAFGGTMTLIVLLVVAGTLGLAIQQRRREFALLRAIAATPRQIHRLIGAETILVSVVAAVLGALPGFGLSVLMRDVFVAAGTLPPDFQFVIDPLPAVVAVAACVVAARLAGLIVARRAARISPVEALGEAAVEPKRVGRTRILVGWVLAAVGLAAAVVLPTVVAGTAAVAGAASSALLLVIAVALLGPRLLAGTVGLLGHLGLGRRCAGFLAGANTLANARRVTSATTPLIMGVALAAVQIFTMTTTTAAAQRQADTGVLADRVVTASDGLAPTIAGALRGVPGVAMVAPVARTQVLVSYREMGDPAVDTFAAQGIAPDQLGRVMNLDVRQGDIAGLTGNTVALSQFAASTFGVGVGGTVTMHLGDGTPVNPRVVAVYGSGLGFGDVTLPNDVVLDHTTDRLDTALLVGLAPHADLNAVDGGLRAAIRSYPGVQVADRAVFTAAQDRALAGQTTVNLVLNLVVLAYIAIAVVNTLVLATAARVREFALLRLVGATGRQVRGMMRGEAGIVIVTAVGLGTLTALPPLVGVSLTLTHNPLPTINPLAYLGIVAVAVALGWFSVTIPTRLAMRPKPVDAIGTRE
jgi:putative ABC transport system permease protein